MLGLCDVTALDFKIGQFKLFSPDLLVKHMSAFDVADAIFETVIFFTEGAYLCFKTRSLKPLLINDHTALELDTEYAQVLAWYDLVKNGNLKKFANMTDQEFEKRLNRLGTSLNSLSGSLMGLDKKIVMDKYQKILIVQNDFVTMKIASGVRHSPWAVELFGESSQGKTTLGDQLLDAVLFSQGMSTAKEFRCAYNPGDKFMSNWTSDKLVMIFDDVSNDKAKFVEKPPTRAIIDVINNQMYYAPKAELESKGKCFVEPWVVLATTNTKHLDAGTYSNCPYSIQRRLIVLTVQAKPEFQRIEDGINCGIDSTKVREHYTVDGVFTPPMFDDIWTITIEKAIKPEKLQTVAEYKPITWRGKKMVDVSMEQVVQWAIEDFDTHKKNQDAMLEGMHLRSNNLERCPHEGCIHLCGKCPVHNPECEVICDPHFGSEEIAEMNALWDKHDELQLELERVAAITGRDTKDCFNDSEELDPHLGRETLASLRHLWYDSTLPTSDVERLYERADQDIAREIYNKSSEFLDSMNWVKIVPSTCLDHEYAAPVFKWLYKDKLVEQYQMEARRQRVMLGGCLAFLVACCGISWWASILSIFPLIQYALGMRCLADRVENEMFEKLRILNLEVSPMIQNYRDKYTKYICGISIGIAAVYGLARAYRAYRQDQQKSQGSLEPRTAKEVAVRDSEVSVWTDMVKRDLPIGESSKRMAPDHLDSVVQKALVYGSIHADDGNGMVNGLMLSSNVILIPNHYFSEFGDELKCTFRKRNPEASGGKFVARLHKKCSYLLPNSDLRVCYIPNGGSFKNIVNYFPTGEMPSVPFRLHWRKKDGDLIMAKGLTAPGVVRTLHEFKGGMYKNLTINTFDGMCGATLVSETNGCAILGVHLGGTAGTPVGCYGSILQQDLFTAFSELKKIEGVVLSGSAGEFETELLGVQLLKKDDLHKKSPLRYLPSDSQVEYFGSCPGRSVTKTDVKVTPISEAIEEVCGIRNVYHGPKLHPDWYGWQTCLANMALPAHPFPHDLLEKAIMDYKEDLLPVFQSKLWKTARPLTNQENLCGVKGKKFLDAIKLNTSIGFPLSGPKRDFVEELEPTEDFPNNRKLDDVIVEEIDRLEACYKKGERGYPIAKACKKDEILAKDKCRIFFGNSLPLTFLIRKYYLPILRVLQMNPLVSECAVGINSHGPEWDEFHKHVTKHGMDRLFGGDYAKYDQKLPSQLIFAALRVLIDFAKECDYSEQDLIVMEALTGDIVFAYIAFNGDLIGLTEGSHISGNSLTVIINGICGSLNLRCYFYSEYNFTDFDQRKKFREHVAISTYGDDNFGSVSKEAGKFTIKGCSEFLAKYGQEYTMPDKESELLDYLPAEDFEFLKRKSVYHPKIGKHIGALLDKSIYKSLHCYMRGKNCVDTPESACAQNIDGALREWFNHGEEKYEAQRLLMKEVASRTGISHLCTGLNESYNDRVVDWFDKYSPDTPPVTP
jgi:hypothetical protein